MKKLLIGLLALGSISAFAQGTRSINSDVKKEYCKIEYNKYEYDPGFKDYVRESYEQIKLVQSSFNEITLIKDSKGTLLGAFNANANNGIRSYEEQIAFTDSLDIPYTLENFNVKYYLRDIEGQKFLVLGTDGINLDIPITKEAFTVATKLTKGMRIICENVY